MLTIVTPTYNRAYLLDKCYSSLCAQTNKDFLWMLIDDGSTDNTEDLANEWKSEGKLKIEYIKKKNGGKASALNCALDHLETKYACCLDSDDTFFPEAVENAYRELKKADQDEKSCGILALRHNADGTVKGKREIPREMTKVKAQDVLLKLNLRTELICFYKSDILKQFRFPEFKGEKFVSPSWMYYSITKDHYYYTSWEKYCECEYIADGLTKNKRKVIVKNPHGYTCIKRFCFDLSPTLKQRISHGIMYDCGCLLGKDKDWLKNVKHKGLAVVLMPAAFVVSKLRFK